jgi:hypothetical protein
MHLDITPTLLLAELDPRLSHLFHAKKEEPLSAHRCLRMNSYGFCEWPERRQHSHPVIRVEAAQAAVAARRGSAMMNAT